MQQLHYRNFPMFCSTATAIRVIYQVVIAKILPQPGQMNKFLMLSSPDIIVVGRGRNFAREWLGLSTHSLAINHVAPSHSVYLFNFLHSPHYWDFAPFSLSPALARIRRMLTTGRRRCLSLALVHFTANGITQRNFLFLEADGKEKMWEKFRGGGWTRNGIFYQFSQLCKPI